MSDYDKMSVHELLGEYAKWANKVIGVHWSGKVMVPDEDLVQSNREGENIKSALCKAVIREASVGNVSIKIRDVDGYPLFDAVNLVRDANPQEWHAYDLIPKETP